MFRLLFCLLICSAPLLAQKTYVVKLSDSHLRGMPLLARITVADTLLVPIATGWCDSSGLFSFKTSERFIQLAVDSAQETCEGTPMGTRLRIDLHSKKDTLDIQLGHFWSHSEPGALFFEEGTLLFTSYDDSILCSFSKIEPARGGYQSLNVLPELYKCGAFAKVELRTFYTSGEDSLYGDSLARVRSVKVIEYFNSKGLSKVEFVVVPILYSTRPLRNADGTFREEECSLISFRILAW